MSYSAFNNATSGYNTQSLIRAISLHQSSNTDNASVRMITLKDGADLPKDRQAAGAEILTEAELE